MAVKAVSEGRTDPERLDVKPPPPICSFKHPAFNAKQTKVLFSVGFMDSKAIVSNLVVGLKL